MSKPQSRKQSRPFKLEVTKVIQRLRPTSTHLSLIKGIVWDEERRDKGWAGTEEDADRATRFCWVPLWGLSSAPLWRWRRWSNHTSSDYLRTSNRKRSWGSCRRPLHSPLLLGPETVYAAKEASKCKILKCLIWNGSKVVDSITKTMRWSIILGRCERRNGQHLIGSERSSGLLWSSSWIGCTHLRAVTWKQRELIIQWVTHLKTQACPEEPSLPNFLLSRSWVTDPHLLT